MSDDLMPVEPLADPEAAAPTAPASRVTSRTGARRRRSRGGRILVVLLVLFLIVVVPLGTVAGWYWMQLRPGSANGDTVSLEIERGWGINQIGDALKRNGVIGSPLAFRMYIGFDGNATFSAGEYTLRKDMGIARAVSTLRKGPIITYGKLALPPGLTLSEIATRVGAQPGLSAQKFLDVARSNVVRSSYQPASVTSLEGLTWPDTYYIAEGEDELTILKRLVQAFDDNANAIGLKSSTNNGVTPFETITVASLIQTEAKLDADRPLIAAVVYNRLRDKMPLQIDATLLYARGNKSGPILNSDKQIDSPYNTYKVSGLPPTPISTVTKASLLAAMNPASVPYKFYVLIDANGKHAFATTLEEHNRNVAEARRKGLL
ncbi:MAG: endolytic transglycosylase MltG [Acidimicrobiia bacterium]